MTKISIIIPLAPNETSWRALHNDLMTLPSNIEVLFVISQGSKGICINDLQPSYQVNFINSKAGRATQMNTGACAASGNYLWFLHADSRFVNNTWSALQTAIKLHSDSLLYFDLAFLDDGPYLMFINKLGVYFRSRVLNIPFGDQGFCIKKSLFENIGGYSEDIPYGEDHIFVWKARQHAIPLFPIGATLYTSARKYKKYGWVKTTFMHQYLWIKQAWPEWKKLYKREVK